MPRVARSNAKVRPTGPAPTMRTRVLVDLLVAAWCSYIVCARVRNLLERIDVSINPANSALGLRVITVSAVASARHSTRLPRPADQDHRDLSAWRKRRHRHPHLGAADRRRPASGAG